METLIKNVIEWAKERNLLHRENAENQYLKFIEECGETARAILKKDENGIIDGFGDIAVTVIILAEQLGDELWHIFDVNEATPNSNFTHFISEVEEWGVDINTLDYLNDVSMYYGHSIEKCLSAAWNEIKNRKGQTIDGVFIKN